MISYSKISAVSFILDLPTNNFGNWSIALIYTICATQESPLSSLYFMKSQFFYLLFKWVVLCDKIGNFSCMVKSLVPGKAQSLAVRIFKRILEVELTRIGKSERNRKMDHSAL